MILGSNRVPFSTPEAAQPGYMPGNPRTGFYSHINPFIQVMERMPAMPNAYRPGLQPQMGPQMLPSVPVAVPTAKPTPATAPTPGGMAGAGFGSTGGTRMHSHVNPYSVMRNGMIPGVLPSGANIRSGYRNVAARVDRSFPFQTAALMPIAPPVAPAMAPTATPATTAAGTNGFGYPGRPRRARRHRWWHWNPPSTAEQVVAEQGGGCETYPPNLDGIKITVCNGRVVKYEDAQGNVRIPGQMPPGFAGW